MRRVLLAAIVLILVLVPFSTAFVLAVFPRDMQLIPVWFWVVWFVLTAWAALEARLRVDWFLDRPDQANRYGTVGMFLALCNVLWSIVALISLGRWS